MTTIPQGVATARSGTNPGLVCRVPSGWVVLCDMQYLRGYTILLADPVVESLNSLDRGKRAEYLGDMALVGDALLAVTGAYRINYAIAGNTDPFLHAHIIPRYLDEPDEYRRNQPWAYPSETKEATKFDLARDRELIRQLADSIRKRL